MMKGEVCVMQVSPFSFYSFTPFTFINKAAVHV